MADGKFKIGDSEIEYECTSLKIELGDSKGIETKGYMGSSSGIFDIEVIGSPLLTIEQMQTLFSVEHSNLLH